MAVSSSQVPSGPVSRPSASTSSLPDTRTTTLPPGAAVRTAKVSGAPREIEAVGRRVVERRERGLRGGGRGQREQHEDGGEDGTHQRVHRPLDARGLEGRPVPFLAVPRVRLDSLLAERGLFESRTRAAAAVIAGQVHLGPGRRRAEKPGQLVDAEVELEVDGPPPYVSRGGVKLANALDTLAARGRRPPARSTSAPPPAASPTACSSAAPTHVVALDVAYGELDYRLREDARVTVIERANARALTPDAAARTAPT